MLSEDYTYSYSLMVAIPMGFVWDGASVPRWLWGVSGIRPDGLIRAAALVHDWWYRGSPLLPDGLRHSVPGCKMTLCRKDADDLFYKISREAGVPRRQAWRAYLAVRMFGKKAWNQRRKKS